MTTTITDYRRETRTDGRVFVNFTCPTTGKPVTICEPAHQVADDGSFEFTSPYVPEEDRQPVAIQFEGWAEDEEGGE